MPKIMFRPNPTPPPFVPPEPVYPENSISVNPFPFEQGQNLTCTLHNVKVDPNAHSIIIQMENIDGDPIFDEAFTEFPIDLDGFIFNTSAIEPSVNFDSVYIEMYFSGILPKRIQLTLF